jgi:hypothetical protein
MSGGDRDPILDEFRLGWIDAPDTPAIRFHEDRWHETGSLNQAYIDLLRSDVPLDQEIRQMLADWAEGLVRPDPPAERRRIKKELENQVYIDVRTELRERGFSKNDAETLAAKFVGKKSVDAIVQQIKRTKRGT